MIKRSLIRITRVNRRLAQVIAVMLILIISVGISACGGSGQQAEEQEAEKVQDIAAGDDAGTAEESDDSAEPWKLDYIDAHGERHKAVIDPSLKMHPYDWNRLAREEDGKLGYEDERFTARKGIDVSSHQGDIDWAKVKAAGHDFAFIRVVYRAYGETGKLFADKAFDANIKGAQAAGLDVGVYVFSQAVNEQEALEEAELVIEKCQPYQLQLPVVFDPETIRDDTARTDNVSGKQFTDNTIAFCEKVRAAGYEPAIYANMVWEGEMFEMGRLQAYPFWYADYEIPAQTPYDFTYWQYSEKGHVDGVQGIVDLNLEFLSK